ncbi:MAG: bifunctional molybdenum cofactor guanylyltransferase MobA/molybdopterin-guanine dinucleotide biosynthesis adaptor protein MobB [Peptococcaceae bacterium]|nr:bifunctional molybdenum cofactor guanylyltransferase MobA/molybdopterin-guanine dinucleotide biosynthesis adaptor protein MobB [Peptococcaceae bacterium]
MVLPASAAILAGGKSKRMRVHKAFLELAGKTLMERILWELSPYFRDVLIVTNDPVRYRRFGTRIVSDIYPDMGPLSGIHSALVHSEHRYVFVVACDLPFVNGLLVKRMVESIEDYDCVVPKINGYTEPLYAVYARSCIRYIENCLLEKKLKVSDLFSQVRVKYMEEKDICNIVDPSTTFYNVNFPQDWAQAWKILSKSVSEQVAVPNIAETTPLFVTVVGTSDSGKTALVTGLVKYFTERGFKVGTVKHCPHGADLDREGKDTWRHAHAGATMTGLLTPEGYVIQRKQREADLGDVLGHFTGVDLVLVEGFKNQDYPKILVHGGGAWEGSVTGLIAVAGTPPPGITAPVFDPEDYRQIGEEIFKYLGLDK